MGQLAKLRAGCQPGCQPAFWRVSNPPQAASLPHTERAKARCRLKPAPQVFNISHIRQRGQATIEYVVTLGGIVIPLIFAIIFTGELLWVWHSAVDFTRDGARYAATHCWQPGGDNVAGYMRTNVPLMVDMDQFRGGQAEIVVDYFRRNAETGQLEAFACEGGECSTDCIPDTVTVRVRNYEFRRFFSYLGLPPVRMPEFQTSVPMEGAGCDPEQGSCLP